MNSPPDLKRSSFSEMQPCCAIISGAHSVFQMCSALSLSEGSILMWMSRMIDMGNLAAKARIRATDPVDVLSITKDALPAITQHHWRAGVPWPILAKDNSPG